MRLIDFDDGLQSRALISRVTFSASPAARASVAGFISLAFTHPRMRSKSEARSGGKDGGWLMDAECRLF